MSAVVPVGLSTIGGVETRNVLVMVRLSGFGQTGPLAERPAMDPVLQAYTGLMAENRGEDGIPHRVPVIVVDADGLGLIDVSQRRVDWAESLIADLADGGERLMPQAHVFAVCDLVLRAQQVATPWGLARGGAS